MQNCIFCYHCFFIRHLTLSCVFKANIESAIAIVPITAQKRFIRISSFCQYIYTYPLCITILIFPHNFILSWKTLLYQQKQNKPKALSCFGLAYQLYLISHIKRRFHSFNLTSAKSISLSKFSPVILYNILYFLQFL